jgi:hypothetical protein
MQGVLVFDDAAARDAAITAPVEGQVVYLKFCIKAQGNHFN